MNDEEHTLLMLRGLVASMPKDEQEKVQAAYDRIRALETELGAPVIVAVALIGAEEAAK